MPEDNWYEILGVAPNATEDDIKAAYKKKVLELHPDRNPSGAEEFKKVVEAHRVLSDVDSRKTYDRRKNASTLFTDRFPQVASQVASNLGNILEEDFLEALTKFLGKPPEPKNIDLTVQITLEDLYNGADKEVSYTRQEICDQCKGRGAVNREDFKLCQACFGSGMSPSLASLFRKQECKTCRGVGRIILNKCHGCSGIGLVKKEVNLIIPIPSDLAPSDRLIVPNEGQANGDLVIQVETLPHSVYEIVNEIDLSIDLPITFYQAILGDYLEIDTLKGPAHFKLEEGTNPDDVRILKGYGLKKGDKVGDLIVKFSINIPKKVNKAQRDLLEAYKNLDQKKNDRQKPKRRSDSADS